MKTKYISPLFEVISPESREFCAESISSAANDTGIFGGNANSIVDKDYE